MIYIQGEASSPTLNHFQLVDVRLCVRVPHNGGKEGGGGGEGGKECTTRLPLIPVS